MHLYLPVTYLQSEIEAERPVRPEVEFVGIYVYAIRSRYANACLVFI